MFLLIFVAMTFACGDKDPGEGELTNVGELLLRVNGLGPNTPADVRVTDAQGMDETFTIQTSHIVGPLSPGMYEVSAQPVPGYRLVGDATLSVEVEEGRSTEAAFTYEPAALSLHVDATPIRLPMGGETEISVKILRAEGFEGEVSLYAGAPTKVDVTIDPTVAPTNTDRVTVRLRDDGARLGAHTLVLRATGTHNGKPIEATLDVPIQIVGVVTTTADAGAGSLRALVDDPRFEGQTILFDAEVFKEPQTIALQSPIEITQPLRIEAELHDETALRSTVILDGGDHVQIMRVAEGVEDVELVGLEFTGGFVAGGGALFIAKNAHVTLQDCNLRKNRSASYGGAIDNRGNVTLERSSLSENLAQQHGGGLFSHTGHVVVKDSTFAWNETSENGGGIYVQEGRAEITGQNLFRGNSAASGGGMMAGNNGYDPERGALLIENAVFRENYASSGGGALHSYWDATIRNSVFDRNATDGSGGGIRNHLIMRIEGSHIADNVAQNRYGGVFNDGIMTLDDSTIVENVATEDGGGIFNGYNNNDTLGDEMKRLTVRGSIIRGNRSGKNGGGIHSIRYLAIDDSIIADNIAAGSGGGVYTTTIPSPNTEPNGGAFDIARSLFVGNEAADAGGGLYTGESSAIHGSTDVPHAGPTIVNSTFTENRASSGAAITLNGRDELSTHIYFSTIVGNTAASTPNYPGQGVGGLHHRKEGTLILKGNILSDNVDEINVTTTMQDFMRAGNATLNSLGYNILGSQPAASQFHAEDQFQRTHLVGSLDDNVGTTETMKLVVDNLFDLIPELECTMSSGTAVTEDQRGEPRPQGSGCSPGAYER